MIINGKYYTQEQVDQAREQLDKADFDRFLVSGVIGAVTDSALLGGILGGSLLGGVLGDLLGGSGDDD